MKAPVAARVVLAMVAGGLATAVFLFPALQLARAALGEGLRSGAAVSPMAVTLHRSVTPRYERWARDRVAGGSARYLHPGDVSATEWPLFGSLFYLWATEALQGAWERDPLLTSPAPREYARGAIEAATRLVIDPGHAEWVRKRWGASYLERENVFYRMLVISAITAQVRLTGDRTHEPLLRSQVEGLAHELDRSPTGLLDDYPGECYPTDVIAALAAIQRADAVLRTDHGPILRRAARGFLGARASRTGLPPYAADSSSGLPHDDSRGCSNSYIVLRARELWPDLAAAWYSAYEWHFWQRDLLAAGFREFPRGATADSFFYDVDAGPVVHGLGAAATAFGIAAARAHGRFDHAYPLSLEMVALSWPLPGGRLLVPPLLSDTADAPLLGELAVLFNLSYPAAAGDVASGVAKAAGWDVPGVVWIIAVLQLGLGSAGLLLAWRLLRPRPRVALRESQPA